MTVLRDGRYVDTVSARDATAQKLVSLMVGREFERKAHREFISDYSDREVVLEVEGLCAGNRVRNASFKLHRGEVLGLTGLVGAGRTELLQAILGMEPATAGTIKVDGKPVTIRHPADAIKLGMGMVPENRKEQGMFLRLSVLDNMTMVHLRKLANRLLMVDRGARPAPRTATSPSWPSRRPAWRRSPRTSRAATSRRPSSPAG